jgi:hypothetical protein
MELQLPAYLLVGHGGYNPNEYFTLKKNQYVIFSSRCGLPGSREVLTNPATLSMLLDTPAIMKYAAQGISRDDMPHYFRNPVLMRQGDRIAEHTVQLFDDSDKTYNAQSGIFKKTPSQTKYEYIGGHGALMKMSQIVNLFKEGIFIFTLCRVLPGTSQQAANAMLALSATGTNVPFNSQWSASVAQHENAIRRGLYRPSLKRKREDPALRIRKKKALIRPLKRTKLNPAQRIRKKKVPSRPLKRTKIVRIRRKVTIYT